MSNPKNQHYLPKMLLKGFLHDGFIHRYDSQYDILSEPRSLKTVGLERHLYTIELENGRNFVLEKMFSKIESDYADLFLKISEHGFQSLNQDELESLQNFIIVTQQRSPMTVDIAKLIAGNLDEILKKEGHDDEKAQNFIEKCKKSPNLLYAYTFENHVNQRIEQYSRMYDLMLYTLESDCPDLILNDNYNTLEFIFKNNVPQTNDKKDIDWSKHPAKWYFPLTKRHCAAFYPKTDNVGQDTDYFIYFRTMQKQKSAHINRMTFNQKNRYVYSGDEAVLKSLI